MEENYCNKVMLAPADKAASNVEKFLFFLLLNTPFLDSDLYKVNGIVSYKINDKRNFFNFEIVNFHSWRRCSSLLLL